MDGLNSQANDLSAGVEIMLFSGDVLVRSQKYVDWTIVDGTEAECAQVEALIAVFLKETME